MILIHKSKEYDLGKLRKRPGKVKVDPDAVKTPISIRLDGAVLADLRSEAERLGIPYQTLISSILHRYVSGELVDPKANDQWRICFRFLNGDAFDVELTDYH